MDGGRAGQGWALVPVLPKTDLDFGFLSPSQTYERTIKNRVWVAGYHQAMLWVRLHAKNAGTGSSIEVILRETDPTDEDDADFVVGAPDDFLGVLVTDGTAVPSLIRSEIALAPGPCLRVVLRGTGGGSAGPEPCAYTMSADLLLRAATTMVVEASRHDYANTGTALQYIPINTSLESNSIANWTTWVAPGDGELLDISIQCSTAAGSTVLGLHINGSTTPIATRTVDIASANTAYTATFAAATFAKGDRLHVSVDPTTGPTNVWITCRWRYWSV